MAYGILMMPIFPCYGMAGASGRKTNREVYMTDIAPTIAALLHIQMPSGTIGHVIEDIIK